MSKEVAAKLQEEFLGYQTANEIELPKENDKNKKRIMIDQYWYEILYLCKSHFLKIFPIWQDFFC